MMDSGAFVQSMLLRKQLHAELLVAAQARRPPPLWCSHDVAKEDPDDFLYQHLLEHICELRHEVQQLREQQRGPWLSAMRRVARREWVVMGTPGLEYDTTLDTWMYRHCCGTQRDNVARILDRRTKQWVSLVDELPYDSVPASLRHQMEIADRA